MQAFSLRQRSNTTKGPCHHYGFVSNGKRGHGVDASIDLNGGQGVGRLLDATCRARPRSLHFSAVEPLPRLRVVMCPPVSGLVRSLRATRWWATRQRATRRFCRCLLEVWRQQGLHR